MNKFIYKNKAVLLKFKRFFNSFTGIEISKYPTPELDRRIKLLKDYNIDVVIDVGANIGQYGSELRNIGYNGRIISFEPTSEAFAKLKKASSKDNSWEVHNISLGERDGESTINISKNSVSSSILKDLPQLTNSAPEATFVTTETITINKLDTLFSQLNLKDKNIYLKIDTQGYEKMVLDGAKDSLIKIAGIQIEMALIPSYEGSLTFEEMSNFLKYMDFKLTTIESGHYDKNTGKLLEVDGVFFK
ncbi:FkbM family methyltransferase [uncultured Flavobacterium sp.]|uniref:FkbM family methyltransferase n=1 Tax=uncultured Flavobacterium sp. TaxID=165435 RepID=UPI0030EF2712|tara:strand:- start:38303 stop:39040 length:738 start_codon:yes stop_codon:yes gene_type:complete